MGFVPYAPLQWGGPTDLVNGEMVAVRGRLPGNGRYEEDLLPHTLRDL